VNPIIEGLTKAGIKKMNWSGWVFPRTESSSPPKIIKQKTKVFPADSAQQLPIHQLLKHAGCNTLNQEE
jgi:hypothetical protein|tara:strand:+ start:2232 stop:2438 length:207 start_codon:yes stop_codon:yes gene_type:complete